MDFLDRIRQAHLDEPCPFCKAESGARCRTPSAAFAGKPHADRIHNGNMLFEERVASGYYKE